MRYQLLLLLSLPALILANPSGHEVKAGSAEVTYQGSLCQIKASDRAIIHWEDFSNQPKELIQFIQPDKQSAILNRVVSQNPSKLLGDLKSNGQVFLINPNGLIIGKDAKIDCASFIASTLDVLDEDFLQKRELQFQGDSSFSIQNEGRIIAEEIRFYSRFFEHDGSMEALQVEQRGGRIFLVAEKGEGKIGGSIYAPSGTVHLLGEKLQIDGSAQIDVSSPHQGGAVLIGGDYKGSNPDIPNSHQIYIGQGAKIQADALEQGDGGKVILWGTHQNLFYGDISARGGESGGNGGFVEVSSPYDLGYFGTVCTLAPLGERGTLYLDPIDLAITGANSNVTGASPFTPTAAPSTLSVATLQAALVGNNVIVTTVGTPTAGSGNITLSSALTILAASGNLNMNAAGNITIGAAISNLSAGTNITMTAVNDITVSSAITWSTATTLTLNASRDIFINANVQHATAVTGGDAIHLQAARDITIRGLTARTSIGSQNSGTTLLAGRDLSVLGGTAGNRIAHVGFYTPSTENASGAIDITCRNLTSQVGTAAETSAHIGHGRIDVAAFACTTTAADIHIAASGDILLQNGVGLNSFSVIGHGAQTLLSGAGSNQNGDITIACGGHFNLSATLAGTVSSISIGHATPNPGPAPGPALFSGDIDIQIGGNLTMGPRACQIGHGGFFTLTNLVAAQGDIRICCGGDANLLANTGPLRIGHFTPSSLSQITSDMDISIGGNLNMTALQVGAGPGNCLIGYVDSVRTPTIIGTYNLSVCNDINFSVPNLSGNIIGLGYLANSAGTSDTTVNIVVGGNWNSATIRNALLVGSIGGDFNAAIRGTWTASSLPLAGGVITAGPSGVTRIYAGGSLLFDTGGSSTFTIGKILSLAIQTIGLDIRAGQDITWPTSYSPALVGPISFMAGHTFTSGELWNGSGSQILSICNQTLSPSLDMRCGLCADFTASSPPLNSTCGAFSPSASALAGVLNLSTTGNLTINSQCTSCLSGNPVSLSIGPLAANDITFPTVIGSVNIGPFFDINLNKDIDSSGNVTLTACNDLNINTPLGGPSDITAVGNITLIGDVDDSGTGNVNLQGGNIIANGGNILIDAGFGAAGGTSSIYQTTGFVNSNNGSLHIQALFDIVIDGNAVSLLSTTGPISMEAGHDISILENIASANGTIFSLAGNNTYITLSQVATGAGSITMITGVDMFLQNALISSLGSHIDLVVDNLFPTAPGIGPGSFNMDGLSIISSDTDYIRVYTALQGLNNIDPAAQFIQAGVPYFFTPGTLYADSLN
ncbi:MAG: filamentous hemagglutinin N-terminal domain-containing protein [Chlamydiales bacterium]|nr:filamentous hemagglutinin N-terminal domain-containing protein [Chlamydiales bacterium]